MNARLSTPKTLFRLGWGRHLVPLYCTYLLLGPLRGLLRAQEPEPPAAPAPAAAKSSAAPGRTYRDAIFVETWLGFAPVFNDIIPMVGIGVRIADRHELWARAGYIPYGDDRTYGIGAGGYRVAFRPRRIVRPLLGVLIAGEAATCSHEADGHQSCKPDPLFFFAANVGLRLEPRPWLGFSAALSAGSDSLGYPFGDVEIGMSLALPQTEPHEAARTKGR